MYWGTREPSVGVDVSWHKLLRDLPSSNIELETHLSPKGGAAHACVGYSIIMRVPRREGYKKGEEKSN